MLDDDKLPGDPPGWVDRNGGRLLELRAVGKGVGLYWYGTSERAI